MNLIQKICIVAFATLSFISNSQVKNSINIGIYNPNQLGILFTQDDNKGTARYNAMSGAFGALGGDISSTSVNPAGAAVAKLSNVTITGRYNDNSQIINYYNGIENYNNTNFNIPQIGAMFVFKNRVLSNWKKSAFFLNYRNKTKFNYDYEIEGNSNFLYYNEHLADENGNIFDGSIDQYISNIVSGKSSVFDIGFSTVHKNKLYLGATLKIHQMELTQNFIFNERNDDFNGNILETEEYTDFHISGNGISFNMGFIYKFNKNLRLGLSYETPTIYSELIEDYYDDFIMYEINNLNINNPYTESSDGNFDNDLFYTRTIYQFKSPSRLTASGAIVFGKKGLLSADYTYKNYTSMEYTGDDFYETNDNFSTEYRNTHALKVGTEWRFDNLSARGGISYEKDPNIIKGGNVSKDNVKGYSLGLGYRFKKSNFDLSFNHSENINYYTIYETGDLSIDKSLIQVACTFTINL